eukprot:357886-Chlamydomonas_euryale.AAC.14
MRYFQSADTGGEACVAGGCRRQAPHWGQRDRRRRTGCSGTGVTHRVQRNRRWRIGCSGTGGGASGAAGQEAQCITRDRRRRSAKAGREAPFYNSGTGGSALKWGREQYTA